MSTTKDIELKVPGCRVRIKMDSINKYSRSGDTITIHTDSGLSEILFDKATADYIMNYLDEHFYT